MAQQQPQEDKQHGLYVKSQLHRTLVLHIEEIGTNLKNTLENKIKYLFENKCCVEGLIKPGSSRIVNYSSGIMNSQGHIKIDVIFECSICNPVSNMIIPCTIRSITIAGLDAESSMEKPSPVEVFVPREYTANGLTDVSKYKVGDQVNVRVIGQRYQLNDPLIYVTGELVIPKATKNY